MRKPLEIMLVESHSGVAGHAEARLTAAGHHVLRCVDANTEEAFPCRGIVDPAACPVSARADVALIVRHGVRPFPSDREHGVSSAIRAGVPVVEDGPDLLDPYAPFLTSRVDADLVEACESAAAESAHSLERQVLEDLGPLLDAGGLDVADVRCEVHRLGHDVRIDIVVDEPIDERTRQSLAVRVFDSVRDRATVDEREGRHQRDGPMSGPTGTCGARRTLVIGLALLAVGLVAAGCGDADNSADSTTTSDRPATTESPSTTAAVPGGQAVVWPPADGSITYDDPVAAATGFATELVGFVDPVVGPFQQGDSRSGEVEVRATADGPVTTVFARQVGPDDTWSVIGAATANIQTTEPAVLAEISSPVTLKGTSTAFEANVNVRVFDRSGGKPLAESFVMGGSMGEMGPFESELAYGTPATADGSIVFSTASMKDGRIWEAAAIGVQFTGAP